jgi:NhaP-type Na+/H+ and K+/H+ antiporter
MALIWVLWKAIESLHMRQRTVSVIAENLSRIPEKQKVPSERNHLEFHAFGEDTSFIHPLPKRKQCVSAVPTHISSERQGFVVLLFRHYAQLKVRRPLEKRHSYLIMPDIVCCHGQCKL